jgi:hypothetical protein
MSHCVGMPPVGTVCQMCGKSADNHNVIEPAWKSPWFWIILIGIIVVGAWLYYVYGSRQSLREWDVIPDPGWGNKLGYWQFRGDNVKYGPADDPAEILGEIFAIPPAFRDLRGLDNE